MWLMTTTGFFSAVRGEGRDDVMVRARSRDDLARLKGRFALRGRVTATPRADYPFRLRVSSRDWARCCAGLASDARGYGNFKGAVAARDTYRAMIYHNVWAELQRLNPVGHRG